MAVAMPSDWLLSPYFQEQAGDTSVPIVSCGVFCFGWSLV